MSNIIIGVTGSIACYKSCELIRLFKKGGANVSVVMTKNAKKFISPLTLATISQNPVSWKIGFKLEHKEKYDLIIIAPATADIIGKIAGGIADDLLTSLVLARKSPLLIAPSMDEEMYLNPITEENIEKLKSQGVRFIGPEKGLLASYKEGIGRMTDTNKIFEEAKIILDINKALSGKKILITAGATREYIDPIRFITNNSSGIMGHCLAEEFALFGANVSIITTTSIETPSIIKRYSVNTTYEMKEMIDRLFDDCDIFISTAAISDFRPEKKSQSKIKDKEITLRLIRNPDILKCVGHKKKDKIIVGFSIDTENPIDNAKNKMKEKNLDMIVVGSLSSFSSPNINPTILYKDGKIEEFGCISKRQFAHMLISKLSTV
ncbi:TPA: bifunctional phosphopantothenoylcysteine decarboxylase/phosphopantothenate--cysteine ligase CoaBC [bacterium]|nr:bifunctional phosphopantothenoylcysteine decarboxylase/phosphopantothenate--cysteine ligase CoaBC [bacterium]